MYMKRLLLASALILFGAASWGAVRTAASCELYDVQAAYNAAGPGDIVSIPAGEATWTTALTVSKPVSIIGAGSGKGGTKLTSANPLTKSIAPMSNGFFEVTGITSTDLVRISGIFFEMTDFSTYAAIYVHGVTMDKIRIDHNVFNHGNRSIEFNNPRGLIDSNYFYNGNLTIELSAGSRANADASWSSLAAGTAEAVFIEDNYFIDDANYTGTTYNERIGCFQGGRYVIRYNHWDSTADPSHGTYSNTPIMLHGNQLGTGGYWEADLVGARRGPSVVEVYNNVISAYRTDEPISSRGGAWLIHDNTITTISGSTPQIGLAEEEYVSGNFSPNRVNWPGEDQVHNTFIWNNTINGSALTAANVANSPANRVIQDQDWFLHRPATVGEGMTLGKETFTGANGASNTYPTDGSTYPTYGTMVFTPGVENAYYGYIPYAYPHSLRSTMIQPGAPLRLRVK